MFWHVTDTIKTRRPHYSNFSQDKFQSLNIIIIILGYLSLISFCQFGRPDRQGALCVTTSLRYMKEESQHGGFYKFTAVYLFCIAFVALKLFGASLRALLQTHDRRQTGLCEVSDMNMFTHFWQRRGLMVSDCLRQSNESVTVSGELEKHLTAYYGC